MNSSIRSVLTVHAHRYPLLQPQDAVKLLYQREFGAGHMIPSEEASFIRLCEEYRSIQKTDTVYSESLGNGLVRLYLNGLSESDLPELNRLFVLGASEVRGSRDHFLALLDELSVLTAEGLLPFSTVSLRTYLSAYRAAGYPAVSHSACYRTAYAPSYRVLPGKSVPVRFFP